MLRTMTLEVSTVTGACAWLNRTSQVDVLFSPLPTFDVKMADGVVQSLNPTHKHPFCSPGQIQEMAIAVRVRPALVHVMSPFSLARACGTLKSELSR